MKRIFLSLLAFIGAFAFMYAAFVFIYLDKNFIYFSNWHEAQRFFLLALSVVAGVAAYTHPSWSDGQ